MPAALTPQTFVAKWRKTTLKESAAAKAHFLDLCRLLDHPTRYRAKAAHAHVLLRPAACLAGQRAPRAAPPTGGPQVYPTMESWRDCWR
jgi:hypothetical protein